MEPLPEEEGDVEIDESCHSDFADDSAMWTDKSSRFGVTFVHYMKPDLSQERAVYTADCLPDQGFRTYEKLREAYNHKVREAR